MDTQCQINTRIYSNLQLQTCSHESIEKNLSIIYTSLKHDDDLTILNISKSLPCKKQTKTALTTVTDRKTLNLKESQGEKSTRKENGRII
jgi:hypothetical protein